MVPFANATDEQNIVDAKTLMITIVLQTLNQYFVQMHRTKMCFLKFTVRMAGLSKDYHCYNIIPDEVNYSGRSSGPIGLSLKAGCGDGITQYTNV